MIIAGCNEGRIPLKWPLRSADKRGTRRGGDPGARGPLPRHHASEKEGADHRVRHAEPWVGTSPQPAAVSLL